MPTHVNIKELRERTQALVTEGREKQAALAKLQTKENPTAEETAQIAAQSTALDDLAAKAADARIELEAAERALERERAFAPLSFGPNARFTSTEPDPALTAGFANLAEFALAVKGASPGGGPARVDERLARYLAAPTNFHQETGTTEGYMVPVTFREQIWELMFSETDLVTLVDIEPTSGNAVELLADESTPWGATGVQAKWRAEGTQMSPSKLTSTTRTVKLNELYAFVLATDELLEDAPRLNARLTKKAADAIRWKASNSIVYGTGVGQPLGYFNSAPLITQGKESGQAADTINATNVTKMYSRMLGWGLSRAVWLINSDIIPQLMTMTIGQQPVWVPPASGLVNAPGGILLGRPVIPSEHCKTLGDLGDIQFVDPMGYYATQKAGGVKFDTSIHLYFDYGIQAFRWTFRIGGQPYLSAAVTPANGSNTKSHFVVLEAR